MNIIFIRHASLIESYNNYEKLDYNLLAQLSRREIDPKIDSLTNMDRAKELREKILLPSIILTSEAIRAQESARLIFGEEMKFIVLKEFNEIPFDLTKLCSSSEFQKSGMKTVRNAFFESIIEGTSLESITSICERIVEIESYLKNLNIGNVVIITHGWLMRFLYAHFALQKNLLTLSADEYLSYPVFKHFEFFSCSFE